MSLIGRGLPTDGWTQPMMNPRDCIHGSLARKCEICERDHEIHVLVGQLAGAVDLIKKLAGAARRTSSSGGVYCKLCDGPASATWEDLTHSCPLGGQ